MSRFSPSGIGEYRGRPNYLAQALGDFADRYSQRRREREVDANRIAEREAAQNFDREMSDVAEERAIARDTRQDASAESRFARQLQAEVERENRGIAREDFERDRERDELAAGVQRAAIMDPAMANIGNADQELPAGALEDYQAAQSVIASRSPRLMEGLLTDRALQPGRDARDRENFSWRLREERRINPPVPPAYNAPDRIELRDGRIAEVLPNGTTRILTGPDGTPAMAPVRSGASGGSLPAAERRVLSELQESIASVNGALDYIAPVGPDGQRAPSGDASSAFRLRNKFLPGFVMDRTNPSGIDERARVAGVVSQIRNKLAGSALTPLEKSSLEPLLADVRGDNPQQVIVKLEALLQSLEDKLRSRENSAREFGYDVGGEDFEATLSRILEEP